MTEYTNYPKRQSLGLGVIQIIAGILCIIFNAVAMFYFIGWPHIAFGIWGGAIFIITGSFGIAAARSATNCMIVTFMIMCIISACKSAILFTLAIIGAFIPFQCYPATYDECKVYYDLFIAMFSLIACLSFINGISSILGSVICCKVACCGKNNQSDVHFSNKSTVQYGTLSEQQPYLP